MSILSQLAASGGCAGGIMVYTQAKTTAEIRNVRHKKIKLSALAKAKMQPLFPKLNLNKVRIRTGCSLPANWFEKPDKTDAMTFGYMIYFKKKNIQKNVDGLNLLMHELVHVDQVRRRNDSETTFACDYGKGFLKGGSYRKNPLEIEAYRFVEDHAFDDMSVDWSSSGSLDKPERHGSGGSGGTRTP